MTDIVERLRAVPPQRTDANNRMLCSEAAEEIEHLRNEVKKWQVLASQGIQIERELRATIASGKLDPAQVWPS